MKQVLFAIICAVILIVCLNGGLPTERYYDCSIAEIHPDYPLEVKQACRKLNINATRNYI